MATRPQPAARRKRQGRQQQREAGAIERHQRADLALHCMRLDMSFHNDRTPGQMIDQGLDYLRNSGGREFLLSTARKAIAELMGVNVITGH